MSLTKVTYSMIQGATVNVLDYIPQSEHAAIANGTTTYDATANIQAAFGGAGTTPDNTVVYFPNGTYKTTTPIKIYRTGATLKNVGLIGESAGGVMLTYKTATKGYVFGEPAISDGLWGNNSNNPALATYTENIQVRNISHKFGDIGLWFVYCKNVVVDTVQGYDLVCVAVGNDAVDDCFNVNINNVTRMNDGLDLSPDAWYSIGIYRTSGFSVTNFYSKFLSAANGTGGNHIILATSNFGSVTNCHVHQSIASGVGLTLEIDCSNVVVANNSFFICQRGIVTYGTGDDYNLIANNVIDTCLYGIDVQGKSSMFVGNFVRNSTTKDIYNANTDAILNTFIGNYANSWAFDSSITDLQYMIGNRGSIAKIFVPAIDFKQYLPAATQETHSSTTLQLTNASGSIRTIAKLETGGRTGQISNIVFHFDRQIVTTSVDCYLYEITATGAFNLKGQVSDTSGTTGVKNSTIVLSSGTYVENTKTSALSAVFIPSAAGVANLIGVSFYFVETGGNNFISN